MSFWHASQVIGFTLTVPTNDFSTANLTVGISMKHLNLVWHGELSLEKVFCEWAVLGWLLVNVTSSILFLTLVLNNYIFAAVIAGYGISLPYNLFVSVGVWRSAERYIGDKRLADLAKLATIIGMVLLSIT